MRNQATFSEIFRALFSLLGAARRDLAIYILVVGGLTAIGVMLGLTETASGTISYGFSVDANDSAGSALFDLLSAIVSIVASYVLLLRYLAASGTRFTGEHRFWSYLGLAILSGLGIVLGFFLLIVPGFILLVRWSAASGFLLGGRKGVFDSLGASWEATKGSGWAIFFAAIVMFFGLVLAIGMLSGIFGIAGETVGGIVTSFAEAAISAVYSGLGIAIYLLVRSDAEELDKVFA